MQSFVRSEFVVSRVIAGETLIIPIRKGVGDLASIYSLNEVGSVIWEALKTASSRREIVDAVEEKFSVDRTQIERDVEEFLSEMGVAGLIVAAGVAA